MKRLSLLFTVSSLVLWAVEISLDRGTNPCSHTSSSANSRNGVDSKTGNESKLSNYLVHCHPYCIICKCCVYLCAPGPAKWFQQQLHALSPAPSSSLQAHCSPLNTSSFSPSDLSKGIGTLAVLGELQLRSSREGGDQLLFSKEQVMAWLGNATSLVRGADVVLTNFPTLIRKTEPKSAKQLLR